MSNTFSAFLIALKMMESGGDYQSVNTLNYIGAYQFGEAALTDLGYVNYDGDAFDNDYSGGFTGKNGIHSIQGFLSDHNAQDQAVHELMQLMWKYIRRYDIDDYAGQTINNIELTTSGMLAASHLLGASALRDYIKSDGQLDLRDPYGTSIVDYITQFNGYDIPFVR